MASKVPVFDREGGLAISRPWVVAREIVEGNPARFSYEPWPRAKAPKAPAPPTALSTNDPPAADVAEDLTQIKGVGAATVERLAEFGVASFDDILRLTEADAERIGSSWGTVQGWQSAVRAMDRAG